jgi:transcriptional regulator with XRE-family HTH domain
MRRAIGQQIAQLRMDSGISQRTLATASGVPQSHLSRIERGLAEPSVAALLAVADALGAKLSVRLFPGTGPRIRDRIQAPIVEALLAQTHPIWKRAVEVPVWRPVRGVIDAVLARPGVVVVAGEIQSELRRLEQQIRWAREKSEALPSAESWPILSGGDAAVPMSRLLVLRSTAANHELARNFEATLAAAYPASASQAVQSLRDPTVRWPGPALIWARVAGGAATILDAPPRGVRVGR